MRLERAGGSARSPFLFCEHTFVTSQGSAYGRLQRAIATRNPTLALSAAAEMPHLSLADALALCLILRDREPAKYGRAAVRWHARFCRETRNVELADAQLVLALLDALAGQEAVVAASALAGIAERRGQREVAAALRRWRVER